MVIFVNFPDAADKVENCQTANELIINNGKLDTSFMQVFLSTVQVRIANKRNDGRNSQNELGQGQERPSRLLASASSVNSHDTTNANAAIIFASNE